MTSTTTGPTEAPHSPRPDGRAGVPSEAERGYRGLALGTIAAAAALMLMTGVFHVIQGIVALVNDQFYVSTKDYVFRFDLTAWGWIHLIGGILLACAGVALLSGRVWAGVVAVAAACLSMLIAFAWLPHYPVWSIIVVAFDVFVIWAVTAHGRDIARDLDG